VGAKSQSPPLSIHQATPGHADGVDPEVPLSRTPFEIGPPGQLQHALRWPTHRRRAPRRGRELSCPPASELPAGL